MKYYTQLKQMELYKMKKEIFYTYHKSYAGLILAYYAGNPVRYTEKQFIALHNVIICLNGIDYRINKDSCVKL
jgi:hypothetical protein